MMPSSRRYDRQARRRQGKRTFLLLALGRVRLQHEESHVARRCIAHRHRWSTSSKRGLDMHSIDLLVSGSGSPSMRIS